MASLAGIFFAGSRFKPSILWMLGGDVAAVTAAVALAFLLRFDGSIPSSYLSGGLPASWAVILGATLLSFWLFRLYSFSLEHVGITDILALGRALLVSALFVAVAFLMFRDTPVFEGLPRSVFLVSYVLTFFFSSGVRLTKRIWREELHREKGGKAIRVLIVGAGDAGAELLRNLFSSSPRPYTPVALVDDDPTKRGATIHGVEVRGTLEDIPRLVSQLAIEAMVIALPSAGSDLIHFAVDQGRQAGLKHIKIVPPLAELLRGEVTWQQLREVQVEDLLGREPFSLDTDSIQKFLQGKRVLITGAAGSIGSELARQAAKFSPSALVLLDQDESGVFMVAEEFRRMGFSDIVPVVGDIRSAERMQAVFRDTSPQIVFHAAAYKHVPLMEQYPAEAVRTNVLGTGVVANSALKTGVEMFVYISTDKVVNPTSVMGATKRVGEMVCQAFNQKNSTRFVSVRFGNVLDSRGSVIPLFREQLKRGGPLEVTHPDMRRYFMVTAEACLLVMQAGTIGLGGEVFVLDMGKPVRIVDLAYEMIRLSGLEPDKDIPVVFSGTRPGEKLFEEILTAEEGTAETLHQKIFMAKLPPVAEDELRERIEGLKQAAQQGDGEKIRVALQELVPSYTPSGAAQLNSVPM